MTEKTRRNKGRIRSRLGRRRLAAQDLPPLEQTEETEDQMREGPRRGFFLLPNLLTTISLMLGFYSVTMSFGAFISPRPGVDYFFRAAWAIFAAMIFDGLDGRVARMTRTTSSFGMQYDSLADLVSFGVAPAALAYNFALRWGTHHGLGWAVALLYVVCAALRLARFNITTENLPKDVFQGLASPASAAVLVFTVLLMNEQGWLNDQCASPVFWPFLILTLALALTMVSWFRYSNFKSLDLHKRHPFGTLVVVIIVLIVIFEEPVKSLFLLAAGYALSAPVLWLLRRRNKTPDPQVNPL